MLDHGLNKEIKYMRTIFSQMETEVAKCSVDKKYFEIEKKELFLENERILEHIICQDVMNVIMHADVHSHNVILANNNCLEHDNLATELLKLENDRLIELIISQDLVNTAVNSLAAINDYKNMEKSFVDEYNETLELKAELAKKNDMVEKAVYNELSNRCSRLENQIFSINELQAQLKANNVSIENLKKHISNFKGKNVVESAKTMNKSNVLNLKVYKLDLQPLSPCIKNNWKAHVDYLKVTQEYIDTLRDIVGQAISLTPLDNSLDYALKCSTKASGSKPRSNTKKNRISQTSSSNKKNNKVDDHLLALKYVDVLRRLESIFTSVYAAVQKLKKALGWSFSLAWLTIQAERSLSP
ncbi:hypothetical protein Tco_0231596 [Tanacetum coccineum]